MPSKAFQDRTGTRLARHQANKQRRKAAQTAGAVSTPRQRPSGLADHNKGLDEGRR